MSNNILSVKILLVEDEEPIREMLRYALEKKGYAVVEAESARQAREKLLTNRPDLMIVDWMMPGESGIEFIKHIKKDDILADIPVMMLTARVEERDKVTGLDCGADDYMTKPVGLKEFQARIKALLRRSMASISEQVIDTLGIRLNLATNQLTLDGQFVSIGSTEFKLLKFFLSHRNKVYSRTQLLDFVWGQGTYLEERTVDVHMLRLRKILKAHNKQHYFVTVRGMGYMFTKDSVEG